MSLLFKAPFTSQPQGAVEVDLASSLGKRLRRFYTPGQIKSQGAVGTIATQRGAAFNLTGAASINVGTALPDQRFTVMAGVIVSDGQDPDASGEYIFGTNYNGDTEPFVLRLSSARQIYAGSYGGGSVTHASSLTLDSYAVVYTLAGEVGASDTWTAGHIVNGADTSTSSTFSGSSRASFDVYIGSGAATGSPWRLYSKPIVWVAEFDGHLSETERASIAANPWQLFKPQSRSLWIPRTAAPAGHTLTAATTSQSSSSSTGSITQSHTLSGSATSQSATSGTGAITHGTTHVLTAASSTQSSTASAGAITQTHLITGAGASQSSASTTGAITQSHTLTGAASSQAASSGAGAVIAGFVHVLTGATSSQSAASSAGAITQSHVLVCAPSVQDSIAGVSSIVQAHVLVAGGCSQLAVSGVGAIWDGVALPFDPSIYVATSPVVSYLANSPAQSYSVTAPAKNYSA